LFISLNYLAFILFINMEDIANIDISTPEFSLGGITNEVFSFDTSEDYLNYIYIVIAIVVAVAAFLIYKYFVRERKVTFQDNCDGDVCFRNEYNP
jgi:hypothetical protein